MPKQNRLKKKADFDRVIQQGKKVNSNLFRLYFLRRPEDSAEVQASRFGVIVTKKSQKLAVKRNRIKRVLRAVLCELAPDVVSSDLDMVFFASPQIIEKNFEEVKAEVRRVLESQNLIES